MRILLPDALYTVSRVRGHGLSGRCDDPEQFIVPLGRLSDNLLRQGRTGICFVPVECEQIVPHNLLVIAVLAFSWHIFLF